MLELYLIITIRNLLAFDPIAYTTYAKLGYLDLNNKQIQKKYI